MNRGMISKRPSSMPTAPMTSGTGPDPGPRNPVPTPVLPRQDAKSNAASCNVAPGSYGKMCHAEIAAIFSECR